MTTNDPLPLSEALDIAIAFDDHRVRERAASNPALTVEQLGRLIDDEAATVRAEALAHPSLSPEQISRALSDERDGIRAAALGNSRVSEEQLERAIGDDSPAVRSQAFQHPNCSRRLVDAVMNGPYAHEAILSPHLDSDDVEQLSRDDRCHGAAAQHLSASADTLDWLARNCPETIWRVANNPNTSIATLRWIEFESDAADGMTFRNPHTPDEWRVAALDPSNEREHINQALWFAQDTDAVLAFLSQVDDVHYHENATGAGMKPEVARWLYERHIGSIDVWDSMWLLSILVENEDTPDDVLAALLDDPIVAESAAFEHLHDVMLSRELIDIAARQPDAWIRAAAAGSDQITDEQLSRFIRDESPNVRAAAAWNANGSGEQARLGLSDPESEVRGAAAGGYALPRELLPQAAADPEPRVRQAAIRSETAWAELLWSMREDREAMDQKEWKRYYLRARCFDVFALLGCRRCGRPYRHGGDRRLGGGCAYVRM